MRLQGYDLAFVNRAGGADRSAAPHDGAGRAGGKTAFAGYLDVERQRQKMRELPPGGTLDSVYMQFMEDYRAWRPPCRIPRAGRRRTWRFSGSVTPGTCPPLKSTTRWIP